MFGYHLECLYPSKLPGDLAPGSSTSRLTIAAAPIDHIEFSAHEYRDISPWHSVDLCPG
jgi:hypothetical protein